VHSRQGTQPRRETLSQAQPCKGEKKRAQHPILLDRTTTEFAGSQRHAEWTSVCTTNYHYCWQSGRRRRGRGTPRRLRGGSTSGGVFKTGVLAFSRKAPVIRYSAALPRNPSMSAVPASARTACLCRTLFLELCGWGGAFLAIVSQPVQRLVACRLPVQARPAGKRLYCQKTV
jgi:hypothetical protein